jgi:hypothetical protein
MISLARENPFTLLPRIFPKKAGLHVAKQQQVANPFLGI